jgi:8-oxo-dGTP pyrophosphatase MutT (NUDIX family)
MPHIHEKIDFCVECYVVYDGKVLLRKHDKYKLWLSVGGHIELDEEPNKAILREVKEEVGLDIKLYVNKKRVPKFLSDEYKILIPPEFMYMHNVNKSHKHIVLVYFALAENDKLKLSEKEVADDCRWFTVKELKENSYGIKEHISFYALEALGKCFGNNS